MSGVRNVVHPSCECTHCVGLLAKICNNALFHTKLVRQTSINERISMVYLDLLYVNLLLRKQHVKCGPPADRLDCRISTKMASQPCGGTIANTVRVFTATCTHISATKG